MLKVAQAVEAWGVDYEKRHQKHGMTAKVTLSAIEGGWPYRCSRVPVFCTLYVDTRLMPDESPLEVQREIEALMTKIRKDDPDIGELDYDMNVFMNQWGSECNPEEFIYKAVERAHEKDHGEPAGHHGGAVRSDACELVRHGIPALNYGPSGRTRQVAREGKHWQGGAKRLESRSR